MRCNRQVGVCISLLCICIWSECAYCIKYAANPDSKIHAPIGQNGINRISIFPFSITQVIGEENSYKLRNDTDGRNIYIIPLGRVGSKLELSLKTNSGFVQDLQLEVANISGINISIDACSLPSFIPDNEEVKAIMQAMVLNQQGKYYVRPGNRVVANNLGLKIKQIQTYYFGPYIGAVLELCNSTRTTKRLHLNDISALYDNVHAISIENNEDIIKSQQRIKAFVVVQDGVKDE